MDRHTLRILGICHCLAFSAAADILWDFEAPVVHPDAIDGIYGYVFPSEESPGRTPNHTARLERGFVGSSKAARMAFRLDGQGFPSAGFGLMLEDAVPQDLRGLVALEVTIHADRKRQVRVALMGPDAFLKAAADTGLTFGRDTLVGTTPVRWSIPLSDFDWPYWATQVPSLSREDLLTRIFAVQFQVGCEAKACTQDTGWLVVDDIRLVGIGGGWTAPKSGDCSGPDISIDSFASGNPRQNDLGGWWYAYTDRSAIDSAAKGASRILNASVPESAQTWEGPSTALSQATMRFELKRKGVHSGYAALETQLAPPKNDTPRPADFPRAKALAFTVSFEEGFPSGLGGIVAHLRKEGRDFDNGADHQVRIPWNPAPRRWCIDLEDLRQPAWSAWIEPFSPFNLLAISFEVKLSATIGTASGGFSISDIALHKEAGSGVGPQGPRFGRPRIVQSGGDLRVVLPHAAASEVHWALRTSDGALVGTGIAPAGTQDLALPSRSRGGVAYLSLREGQRSWTLAVPSKL